MTDMQNTSKNFDPNMDQSARDLDVAIDNLRGITNDGALQKILNRADNLAFNSFVMKIPLQLNIVISTIEMNIEEMNNLTEGSTIMLNKQIGDALDIAVNGVRIAKGVITMSESDPGQFGLRITEILN